MNERHDSHPAAKLATIRVWIGNHRERLNEECVAAGKADAILAAVEAGFVQMSAVTEPTPEARASYAQAVDLVTALHDEITGNAPGPGSKVSIHKLENTVRTVFCATGVTAATMNVTMPPVVTIFGTAANVPYDYRSDAAKCARFDLQLSRLICQAWECGLGGGSDPWRSAMYTMRQGFDQLLDRMAPPAEVQKTKYCQPKTGDDAGKVYRRERLEYAAHTHVDDLARRNTLLASSRHTLEIHELLNRAHSREATDETRAQFAVWEMHAVIMQWVDGMCGGN